MGKEECPSHTGVSGITGKIVKIRHASEADMVFIADKIKKYDLDAEDLHYSQFVVASENGDLVGFGRLKKIHGFYEIGCIAVVEERRGIGIGSLIVKHLLDIAPVKIVYTTTDLVDYFKRFGFVEMGEGTKELFKNLDDICKSSGKPESIMVYEKA